MSGESLEDWRRAYATMGASEAWGLHGDWIKKYQPKFSDAISARWKLAAALTEQDIDKSVVAVSKIRNHIRALLGSDAVMIVPSAASIAPILGATGDEVDAIRMRTMQITCIAGIGGLPQVSIPFRNKANLPIGVSLVGPVGSDLELIRLAIAIAKQLS